MTPRQHFSQILSAELAQRGMKPADVLRKRWSKGIKDSVRVAMGQSYLFHSQAVAGWLGITPGALRARINSDR